MKTISKFLLEHNPPHPPVDLEFRRKIIDFFRNNEYPDDEQLDSFVRQLGIDRHRFEHEVYSLVCDFFCYGCYVDKIKDVDPVQLKKGIKVEKEHTRDPWISLKITIDHLCEIPKYYDYLEKMENEAKANGDFIEKFVEENFDSTRGDVVQDQEPQAVVANVEHENVVEEFGNSAAGISGAYESLPTKTPLLKPETQEDKDKEDVKAEARKYVMEVLKKVRGGYVIAKHSGKDKGKRLPQTKKPVSKRKAKSILSAIYFSKHGKGK